MNSCGDVLPKKTMASCLGKRELSSKSVPHVHLT